MNRKPLIILTGPTAVGKTDLSIKLAKAVDGEIISADSMQVYKRMDIGTAKVTESEMQGVPHHLIDFLDFDENFDAFTFQRLAKNALEEIYKRGHIPIVCGGTGFYIQGLLYDIEYNEEAVDTKLREELSKKADEEGPKALHLMLKDLDPVSYESIPYQNVKRVIRALEYVMTTGEMISSHNEKMHEKESAYNFAYFVINNDRNILYDRINLRVDKMMEAGLLDEVKALLLDGLKEDSTAGAAIGYRELIHYLNGECTLAEAVDEIKQNSRHYAKRQLTWFRREKEVIWLDRTELKTDDAMLDYILKILKEKEIINE